MHWRDASLRTSFGPEIVETSRRRHRMAILAVSAAKGRKLEAQEVGLKAQPTSGA